jgi:DNA-nicking Smr family endonuclease
MKRRTTSDEERQQFETAYKEARPLAPIAARRNAPKPGASGTLSGINGATALELRKGTLEPDARLDLHGMTERAAHRALVTFVRGAQMRGHRLLLIVTGKGTRRESESFDMLGERRGVLKSATPRWLREAELAGMIADIRSAHRRHGGDGALYVYLRKR